MFLKDYPIGKYGFSDLSQPTYFRITNVGIVKINIDFSFENNGIVVEIYTI